MAFSKSDDTRIGASARRKTLRRSLDRPALASKKVRRGGSPGSYARLPNGRTSLSGEEAGGSAGVTSLGATDTPASISPWNPPRTTDTRLYPACISCSATRALVASSGQSQ